MKEIVTAYKLLALGFQRPSDELLAGLAKTELFAQPLAKDSDFTTLAGEYTRIFSLTVAGGVAPYELEYGPADSFNKTQRMADIAGFYRAFGVALTAQERVDHIGAELEFMHWVTLKESSGREAKKEEPVHVCRDAAAKFMQDHLGRWAPFFGRQLAEAAYHPFYLTLGNALRDFINYECDRLSVKPDTIATQPPRQSEVEVACQLECTEAEARTQPPRLPADVVGK